MLEVELLGHRAASIDAILQSDYVDRHELEQLGAGPCKHDHKIEYSFVAILHWSFKG